MAPYLIDKGKTLQVLASRLPNDLSAMEKIDLSEFPEKEREVLIQLTQQLYSFIEVRFLVTDEPPWGDCAYDVLRYTRPPSKV